MHGLHRWDTWAIHVYMLSTEDIFDLNQRLPVGHLNSTRSLENCRNKGCRKKLSSGEGLSKAVKVRWQISIAEKAPGLQEPMRFFEFAWTGCWRLATAAGTATAW